MQQGDPADQLNNLLSEYNTLDPERDASRIRELMDQGSGLIDPKDQPQKWAAFRFLYAQFSEEVDPQAALAAYRASLAVLDPIDDREIALDCHRCIGQLMVHQLNLSSGEQEEAIAHLEAAVSSHPDVAVWLAVLYRFRIAGDPWQNWKKRLEYLELDASRINGEEDPVRWARAQNELAIACEEEPDVDFNSALELRIKYHLKALTALGSTVNRTWIRTRLYLSECYLFRLDDAHEESFLLAEQYNQQALEACSTVNDPILRVEALLGRVKVLAVSLRYRKEADLHEGLRICDEAAGIISPDEPGHQTYAGSIESFRANLYLKLVKLGKSDMVDELVAHAGAALEFLSSDEHIRNRRMILQVAAEGLICGERFVEAVVFLEKAFVEADRSLGLAETIEARLERIWEFRDSSALLSWCLLQLGQVEEALQRLDQGKARFWSGDIRPWSWKELNGLIPSDGALLFGNFSMDTGAVVVVAESGIKTVWLPRFGKKRVMELQRGESELSLGGWLLACSLSNSRHGEWQRCIDDTAGLVYTEFWLPVLDQLALLNIGPGAELVWFSQGGSSFLPMHAAWHCMDSEGNRGWLLDDYAFRYAPSVRSLVEEGRANEIGRGDMLLISNPTGDLEYSEIECALVQRSITHGKVQLLHGEGATAETVIAALAGINIFHFSSHAFFDLHHPLDSSLILAKGAQLSLRELIPIMQAEMPAMVVLSACETGRVRITSTPDESLGFPAAFLHSGVRTVLSTLWPVDDRAATFLVSRYYRELLVEKKTPARALQSAQKWLQRVTSKELRSMLGELRNEPSPVGPTAARFRTELRAWSNDSCPFAAPYYWAAFTISGKE